jgi:hypothetical protein
MRRIDILKLQLLNSRGRFFTAKYVGPTKFPQSINFKVSEVLTISPERISVKAYVPSTEKHQELTFFTNKLGDLHYLSCDKTRLQMTGTGI